MKSLPKFSIMSTYSLATRSCILTSQRSTGVLFRVNLKQTCVQRLCSKPLSSSSVTDNLFANQYYYYNNNNNMSKLRVKGCMLNVHYYNPFHSNFYHSNDSRLFSTNRSMMMTEKNNESSVLDNDDDIANNKCIPLRNTIQKSSSSDLTLPSPSSFQVNFQIDQDEMKKQDIWDVGPTPVPTFNFAAYANNSEIIKKMVKLGVDLSKVEVKKDMLPFILKLNFEKTVTPCLRFLCDNGVDPNNLGWYLTKNPFLLKEDLRNLEKRLDYLRSKEFPEESILRIINVNPYWLSFSVARIDRRLGFFQTFFHLNGSEIKVLAARGPKLITSNLGRVKDVTFTVKEEMGFNSKEITSMLIERPRIWRENPKSIWGRFDFLHNCTKLSHKEIVRCPELLITRQSRLRNRIGFLQHVDRAQFDPEKPNYVPFKMVYAGDDAEFATTVAKSSVLAYNDYMKSL